MLALKKDLMLEDYEKKRRKQVATMRSLLDYAMGVLFVLLGALFFFHEKFKITITERLSPDVVRVLGVIFALYGVWRIYRGYKKNYFQ